MCHIDEGFDFLGFRIQRQIKRGSNMAFVYSWPSRKSLSSIMAKVKAITKQGTNNPLSDLLRQINAALRGWTIYFRHGVSKDTFNYLHHFTWLRVVGWLRRKHRRANWKWIRRRYLATGRGARARRRSDALQPRSAGHPLPLSRGEDPYTVGADEDEQAEG